MEKNALEVGQKIVITEKIKYFCLEWKDIVNTKNIWYPNWPSSNKLYIKGFQFIQDQYCVKCYVKGECENNFYYFLYSDVLSMIIEQNKKPIIGYKLLKELPFVKPGTESYLDSENECSFETNSTSFKDEFIFTKEEMDEKPDWFEPIYEKEFEVGEWVVVKNFEQAGEGNGISRENHVCKLLDKSIASSQSVTGIIEKNRDFVVKEIVYYYGIKKEHIIRRATEEEIEKNKKSIFKLSNGKEVEINKTGIYAEGVSGEVSPLNLKSLLNAGTTSVNSWAVELKDATFKIGCYDNVKLSEIKEILEIYKSFQD